MRTHTVRGSGVEEARCAAGHWAETECSMARKGGGQSGGQHCRVDDSVLK